LAALVMIQIGDLEKGRLLSGELDREYPSSTFVQKYWLPVIHAGGELRQGNAPRALGLLSAVESLDSAAPDEFSRSTLYPVYVRGEAYLTAGDGRRAAAEFQKFVDHPGMVLNCPLAALARLGLARSYARSQDFVKARAAYREFLQLWKGADPGLTVLEQAKGEYANLP
jgi:eukaryotic-like serine/threonine-protein kinase